MTFSVRLRLSLADRAGALGQAATVIGIHGGNIVSVDVHGYDGELAVDELVVDFEEEPHYSELADDLAIQAGARLIHHERGAGTDVATSLLLALSEGVRSGNGLRPALGVVCPTADWELVETRPSSAEPGIDPADPSRLRVPLPDGSGILVASRRDEAGYTRTEVARVAAVVGLYAEIRRLATPRQHHEQDVSPA